MSFTDHKITQFTHRIVDLPDQPNLPADELKARFDSSPEELRQAVNGICDDATTLSGKVDSILAETFDGVVEKSMLSEALAEEIDAKATQTALAAEVDTLEAADSAEAAARQNADNALSTRVSSLESAVPQKCQVYVGTYSGNQAASRVINLGFRPKAVIVMNEGYFLYFNGGVSGAMAVDGTPAKINGETAVEIVSNGFWVGQQQHALTNGTNMKYFYVALR